MDVLLDGGIVLGAGNVKECFDDLFPALIFPWEWNVFRATPNPQIKPVHQYRGSQVGIGDFAPGFVIEAHDFPDYLRPLQVEVDALEAEASDLQNELVGLRDMKTYAKTAPVQHAPAMLQGVDMRQAGNADLVEIPVDKSIQRRMLARLLELTRMSNGDDNSLLWHIGSSMRWSKENRSFFS